MISFLLVLRGVHHDNLGKAEGNSFSLRQLPRGGAGFGLVASLRTRRVLKVNSYSLSAAPSRGSWLWVSCITANPAGVEGQLLQPLGSSLAREPGTNRLMENGSLSTAYGTPSAYGFFLYQTVPVVPIKRLPREGAGSRRRRETEGVAIGLATAAVMQLMLKELP